MKPEKIVVLGLMSHFPVAGVLWQTIHYLVGLQRLGYDVYYVEAHGCTPTKLMQSETDDGPARAAAYIAGAMDRFGFAGRWAYDTRFAPRRVFGLSETELNQLYENAAVIINLHGGTTDLPDHIATDRFIYLETDPVEVQIDLAHHNRETMDYLDQHGAFFSYGENIGRPDCRLPVSPRYQFLPTRQPVILDFWEPYGTGAATAFTTIGNWRQPWRERHFQGEVYTWSKHFEFLKFIDLPRRTAQPFELALSSYDPADQAQLEAHGWRVRHALDIAHGIHLDAYRQYIGQSRGEFTVAKDQNIRLRSGWFSDRAVTYLAAGRPVITQETGFSNIFPTGTGLFAFSTIDDILAAVDAINSDYPRHRRAALDIAREYFSHEVVLKKLLADIGVVRRGPKRPPRPDQLVLTPTARGPTRLPDETVLAVQAGPVPVGPPMPADPPKFSVIIVTFNGLLYTKMCLASLLPNPGRVAFEVIVVDNASTDGTPEFLHEVATRNPHVRIIANTTNRGFAAANNQALAIARGNILVLLNNDTLPLGNWLGGLQRILADPSVGLAGPVTNYTCNEAQIDAPYRTVGELVTLIQQRAERHAGRTIELPMLAMFCVALRRDVFEKIGPLDERFGIGTFEDDDYAMRLRQAGYRIVCAEDTFVYHFGQASFGELYKNGVYDKLLEINRRRFEEKWGVTWQSHKERSSSTSERRQTAQGVNVAGYLRTESGLGSATRGYVRALGALGGPVTLHDLSDLNANRSEDRTLTRHDTEQPHSINLVCADIEPQTAIISRLGPDFFQGRYNIAVWAWELPRFPQKLVDRCYYYDELWVETSFIARALAPVVPVPVICIPPVLTMTETGSREQGRRQLEVSPQEFVYLFIFDVSSHLERKNPQAVIEAFKQAFTPADPVRLVLKCVNADRDPAGFAALQAKAQGHRITLADGYWPIQQVRDLMAACDCYVSLHRSEGTGLTISDAMALGKPVIATGWSGNMDFMNAANSFPVRYELVELTENIGPYRAGESWADPSVAHAAELMRFVQEHPDVAQTRGQAARREIENHYSEQSIARLIQQRLETIDLRRRLPVVQQKAWADYTDYVQLPRRVSDAVNRVVPVDTTVLVVSKGDAELLKLGKRRAWHFPQTADGVYAGGHPADSAAAMEHLESLRAKGGRYLVLPKTSFWWLEHFGEFAKHLGPPLSRDESCVIFALNHD